MKEMERRGNERVIIDDERERYLRKQLQTITLTFPSWLSQLGVLTLAISLS